MGSKFKIGLDRESSRSDTLQKALAEFLGTATLVFLGCMGCVGSLGVVPSHLQITLNFGLTIVIVIQCIGHISHAHINPAITLGAVVLGKKTVKEGVVYFASQLFGAIVGYGLLKAVTPFNYLTSNPGDPHLRDVFCVTDLNPRVAPIQGILLEGLATAILMLIACAVWDSRNSNNTDSVPLKFGLAVTALATAVGPYTGCSMNPVRSLAPALWNNYWDNHWIYWVGPLGGSLLTSLVYKSVFSTENDDGEDTLPETVALSSVEMQKSEHI